MIYWLFLSNSAAKALCTSKSSSPTASMSCLISSWSISASLLGLLTQLLNTNAHVSFIWRLTFPVDGVPSRPLGLLLVLPLQQRPAVLAQAQDTDQRLLEMHQEHG